MREKQPQSRGAAATQTATLNWNTFLRLLAPQFINKNTNILISKEDETISFEIDTARLKEFEDHFNNVLKSQESFDRQLSYKHKVISSTASELAKASNSVSKEIESPRIENVDQAKAFMAKLFGAETMDGKNRGCPVNFNTFFEIYEKGVLISGPDSFYFPSRELLKIGQAFLCGHFNGVTTHMLQQIIAGVAAHLEAPDRAIMKAEESEGFVKTCFGFIEATAQVYFDIGRFLQLIYPPKIHVAGVNDSKTRIVISASHLLLYVKQLSRHGILFTVEVNYGKVSAQPLVFPHRESIQRPLTVFMVLDDSGSMEEHRRGLFDDVKELIQKIAVVAPNADIDLTLFSSRDKQKRYKEKAKGFDIRCFDQESLSGYTALYDALLPPLKRMKPMLNTHNVMLVVFTDGRDNNSALTQEDIVNQINDIQRDVSEGAMPPEIHAIGCGNVDEKVLNQLAQAALHEQYTRLKSMDSLAKIMSGIEGFEYGRAMAEFRTTIEDTPVSHQLPIPLNGQPHVVHNVTIPLSSKPVLISFKAPTKGQELALSQVTLQITTSQAQQTMNYYATRVKNIYDAESVMPAKKIAQLNGILSEMNEFCTKAPQQVVLALQADLQEEIELYNAQLRTQQETFSAENSSPTASSPSLGRDSPINSGTINRSPRAEVTESSIPTPR